MPQAAWSATRERQYEHIKDQAVERGTSKRRAAELAARTVNKNRAQSGESEQASKSALRDVSPEHRGGTRTGTGSGPGGRTKEQLYQDARRAKIPGRSKMTKQELERALGAR